MLLFPYHKQLQVLNLLDSGRVVTTAAKSLLCLNVCEQNYMRLPCQRTSFGKAPRLIGPQHRSKRITVLLVGSN